MVGTHFPGGMRSKKDLLIPSCDTISLLNSSQKEQLCVISALGWSSFQ